jgi:hypothetical protein
MCYVKPLLLHHPCPTSTPSTGKSRVVRASASGSSKLAFGIASCGSRHAATALRLPGWAQGRLGRRDEGLKSNPVAVGPSHHRLQLRGMLLPDDEAVVDTEAGHIPIRKMQHDRLGDFGVYPL